MKFKHNGREYNDNDPMEWNEAIEISGFYFQRAKYLKLPFPPACFVFDLKEPTEEQNRIIEHYHRLFKEAETK